MSQSRMAGRALIAALALAGATMSAGCGREAEDVTPVAQGQSERAIENLARDVTVLGCLRAGEAANTFVVTASEAGPEEMTRTYALHYPAASQPDDLHEHVGRQVEVRGVVRAQDAVTSATPATAPANEPVGTGGEPRVRTTTALAIEHLEVNSLRPVGEACGAR